ncbi:MAG: hypothetical protein AAGA30_00205 [Planctomycetota bacterium]
MTDVAKIFDENNGRNILHRLPKAIDRVSVELDCPWQVIRDGEMPPMMFQLRFRDGHMESYAYSDIREVHCRDAGHVEIYLYSICKKSITFEGRHLKELANLFCIASLRSIHEADSRDLGRPESSPEITNILVQQIET